MSAAGPVLDAAGMAALRRAFARQMLGLAGVEDAAVEAAFAAVLREAFLGPPPWRFVRGPGDLGELPGDPVHAYQDLLFALDPARGVNNGSPSLHARLLHALAVLPGDRVAHIGAGTGYYTALLAELVGPSGRVGAVELDAGLAQVARANLAAWGNAEVARGDGAARPEGEVDRVYVNFAAGRPAAPWVERLAPGGTLVFPLCAGSRGAALLVRRLAGGLAARWLGPVQFVPAEGALAGPSDALAAAFARGGVEFVRSLRWREPPDPARSWHVAEGWSLSYDPVEGEEGP